jgi:hypothetical protein
MTRPHCSAQRIGESERAVNTSRPAARHRSRILICASLALLLAGAWTRSLFVRDGLTVLCRCRTELSCDTGRVVLYIELSPQPWKPQVSYWRRPSAHIRFRGQEFDFAGFAVARGNLTSFAPPAPPVPQPGVRLTGSLGIPLAPGARYYGVLLPLWFPIAIAAIPLVRFVALSRRRRRRFRHDNDLCLRCGYDLRASTGRCPECGTAIPLPDKAGGLGNAVDGLKC